MKGRIHKGSINPNYLERDDYLKYLVDKDGRIYYDVSIIGNILTNGRYAIHFRHTEGKSILRYHHSDRIKTPKQIN